MLTLVSASPSKNSAPDQTSLPVAYEGATERFP